MPTVPGKIRRFSWVTFYLFLFDHRVVPPIDEDAARVAGGDLDPSPTAEVLSTIISTSIVVLKVDPRPGHHRVHIRECHSHLQGMY